MQTNAGHHTKEGVLNSIVSVPIRNWMSVAMTVSLGTLKLLVHVSKVGQDHIHFFKAVLLFNIPHPLYANVGLTIGTEQSFYSIREDAGSLEVCIDVLLGSIPSNDTYTISYTTSESAAEGN